MKKRLSVLLALVCAFMCVVAVAAPVHATRAWAETWEEEWPPDAEEETVQPAAALNTLTVTSKVSGHNFEAYQVFAGEYADVDGKGTLSNVTWGSGVLNGDAIVTALKEHPTVGTYFSSVTSAADVARVLSSDNFPSNAANIDAVADVISQHLSGTKHSQNVPTGTAPAFSYAITDLPDG